MVVVSAPRKGKIKSLPKSVQVLGLFLIIICVVAIGGLIYNHSHSLRVSKTTQARQEIDLANETFQRGDKIQALEHAKKALTNNPNSVSNILLVANLTQPKDASLATQYYIQALNKFKQQNNLESASVTAVQYWIAAHLAQRAGEINQAKQYYQEVIKMASSSNSYEQSLARQSQVELEALQ